MPDHTIANSIPQKPINIYFNRCFSTTPKIIQHFLSYPDTHKFKIHITHGCTNYFLQEVADYFEVEPSLNGRNYVDYCLNFCLKHEIDMFVPRYNVTTLIDYKEDFDRIGVKVMFIGSSETYQVLESKLKTYEALYNTNIIAIPKTLCVKNYEDFQMAYKKITEIGSSACMKPILIEIAQKLTKRFDLSYLYNIQVKYHKEKVYLMEINTRMSAGIHKSSLAGVNFLYLAIKLLMGEGVSTGETIRWDFQIRTIENYELTDLG